MTNSPTVVRSLLIYAICLPMAILVGYMLASPLKWGSFITVGIIFGILAVPLLLKFHHPLLVLAWNASMIIFFLPGAPKVWLPLVVASMAFSIVRRTIDPQFRFISVPSLARPLIVLAIVVLLTAELTGGIGLKSLGGSTYGGRRYVFLFGAILGYFALTAHPVPRERANLYIGLYLLGGITSLIGDVLHLDSPALNWIFLFFPPNLDISDPTMGIVRFSGIYAAGSVLLTFTLARYGIREIFTIRHPIRFLLFMVFAVASMFGGFRTALITLILVFSLQFFFEGLHRTRLLPVIFFGVLIVCCASLPFLRHLPFSVQRTMSFLPLLPIDPMVRANAEGSSGWRLEIWKAVLPEVPQYLLRGKGLAMSVQDFDYSMNTFTGAMHEFSSDQGWAALAGDYHNGPLSVIIQFGIWGALAFIWFLVAAFRVVYRNYRYGDPSLRTINAFLFASFITKVVIFFFVFGGFYSDMQLFVGLVAMSVCLNGGVAARSAKPAPVPEPVGPVRFQPVMSRPQTAFGRAR